MSAETNTNTAKTVPTPGDIAEAFGGLTGDLIAANAALVNYVYGGNGVPRDKRGRVCGVVPREYIRRLAMTDPVPGSVPQSALWISEAARVSEIQTEFFVDARNSPGDVSLKFFYKGRGPLGWGVVTVKSVGYGHSTILAGGFNVELEAATEVATWRRFFEEIKEIAISDALKEG